MRVSFGVDRSITFPLLINPTNSTPTIPFKPFLSFPGRQKLLVCAQSLGRISVQHCRASMDLTKEFPTLNRNLYPNIEPYSSGFLKVSDVHTLYWEQSGNPNGHPVVFLHGGPGGGTSPSNRRFFDPEFYRIILFDQRGAGRSTPHACLEENTTWDLVEDIEKLREHLDIQEWQVFGGSWGSTLALAYSQTHPDKVTGMVLRGIFLLRKKELDWFYEGGAAAIFPDAWESFRDFIPENERGNFISAYSKRLNNSKDLEMQYAAAKTWTKWEMSTAYLHPNEDNIKKGDDDAFSLAFARIENHYFLNKGFLPSDSFLLDNIEKIRHIQADKFGPEFSKLAPPNDWPRSHKSVPQFTSSISPCAHLHSILPFDAYHVKFPSGRYDVCCPMMSAWDLHRAWPEAELKIVQDAGHSANEPGIAAELVAANEKHKNILKANGVIT